MFQPDSVIYHGGCADGFTAAWVVDQKYPGKCVYLAGVYGQEPRWDLIEGRDVAIVDFSYKRPVMIEIIRRCRSLLVLDHHKSAQAELEGLSSESAEIHFDMNRSGARMAWDYFFPEVHVTEIPLIIKYVEDTDLWRFQYKDSKPFVTALRTLDQTFENWSVASAAVAVMAVEGESMLKYHLSVCRKIIEDQTTFEEYGFYDDVPTCNCPHAFSSDVGNMLLQTYPDAHFAATWYKRDDGLLVYSLRSEDSRVDVSEVAAEEGGGGHRNASGFQVDLREQK